MSKHTQTISINLGIITGEQKRALEQYIDSRFFSQRKSYDEYYVDIDVVQIEITVNDLLILAENFKITVAGMIELEAK